MVCGATTAEIASGGGVMAAAEEDAGSREKLMQSCLCPGFISPAVRCVVAAAATVQLAMRCNEMEFVWHERG